MATAECLYNMLGALQLGDSFFPSGVYTQSHGLESMVEDGLISGAGDLVSLLGVHLQGRLAKADLPVVLAVHCSGVDGVVRADRALTAVKLAAEEREASRRVGRRLVAEGLRLASDLRLVAYSAAIAKDEADGNAAVAFGLVAAAMGLDASEAALVMAYSFSAALVAAAMRLTRLGHGEAQSILRGAWKPIIDAVETARQVSVDELAPSAPGLDIASARHQRSSGRLFAS